MDWPFVSENLRTSFPIPKKGARIFFSSKGAFVHQPGNRCRVINRDQTISSTQQCPTRKRPPTAMSKSGRSRSLSKVLKWQGGELFSTFTIVFFSDFLFSFNIRFQSTQTRAANTPTTF